MDAAKLASKIYKGYDKAAKRIGFLTYIKRDGFVIGQVNASFNAEDMHYSKPNKYGHPTWWCLIDGTQTRVGDYLYNDKDGMFFIAAMQQALPILVISCNRVISIKRPMQQTGIGAANYNADTVATEIVLAIDVNCSILASGAGKSNSTLPGDNSYPQYSVLLPAIAGVTVKNADIIIDDLGQRYSCMNVEITDLGYRIIAQLEVA